MKLTQMLRLVRWFRLVALCFALAVLSAPTYAQVVNILTHDERSVIYPADQVSRQQFPDAGTLRDHVTQAAPIFEYGRGLPHYVQWDPQGDTVLVTTPEGVLWRYDARSLETIDHFSDIVWARYSTSGAWLFTQGLDDTWAIRRADDPAAMIADGFSTVWQHPESAWLVTVDTRGTALRPNDNPTQIALGGLQSVHFSPDAAHVLTFDASTGFVLRHADLTPLAEQRSFPDVANSVHWSPNSQRIALFSGTDQVDIASVSAGEVVSFTLPDQQRYTRVQWSPDSRQLLDSDYMGNIRIWEPETGQLLLELPTGEAYLSLEERDADLYYPPNFWYVSWSADGSHVFRCVSNGGDIRETCRFYDAATGAEVGGASGDSLGSLQTDLKGRYFISSEGVFHSTNGQLVVPFDTSIDGGGREFSPDGRRVALASAWHSDIHIYDLDVLRLEHTLDILPSRYDYLSMNWSPDGARLATWGRYNVNNIPGSGLISFWDMNTGLEVGSISEHILFGQKMAFSTDSSTLAAADNLGNIALFDTSTGDLVRVLSGLEERAEILAWQPGGSLLAATTGRIIGYGNPPDPPRGGTQVRLWDTRTGDLIATLDHTQTVLALLWHPSGRLLVTDDFTGVSLWNTETGMREHFAPMSGGLSAGGVRYRWTRDGDILVRGHYNCSGGYDSVNFLDMTTLQQYGTIECGDNPPYEWNETVGGIPRVNVECETTGDAKQRCWIHVRVLLLEPENTLNVSGNSVGRTHTYDFGEFDQRPQTFISSDSAEIVVVTESALQFWQLGADSATLLWSAEPAANVIWSSDEETVALVADDLVRIVSVESGEERAVITDTPPDISAIEWSQDNAFILIRSESGAFIFDSASGAQIPLPAGVEAAHWEHGFLCFRHSDDQFVWWDVRTQQIVFVGEQLPRFVSEDGRFGAETKSGVLRLWGLIQR